jgi:hypothetical protein
VSTYYSSTHSHLITHRQKLTARDWDIIRQLRAAGVTYHQLALAFDVTAKYLRSMI